MRITAEYCLFCRRRFRPTVRPFVCRACLSRLPFRRRNQTVDFGVLTPVLAETVRRPVRCPFFYEGDIRRLILHMKFGGGWYPARALGPLMAETIRRHGDEADAVIPLPLHPHRQKQRGFNQAERLAAMCADKLALPLLDKVLLRVTDTPQQSAAKSETARYRSILSAFRLADIALPPRVFLIDDVLTTGATLAAASQVLAAAGVTVYPVVCASNRGKAMP